MTLSRILTIVFGTTCTGAVLVIALDLVTFLCQTVMDSGVITINGVPVRSIDYPLVTWAAAIITACWMLQVILFFVNQWRTWNRLKMTRRLHTLDEWQEDIYEPAQKHIVHASFAMLIGFVMLVVWHPDLLVFAAIYTGYSGCRLIFHNLEIARRFEAIRPH